MNNQDTLTTFALVSAAFAGFAGLAGALSEQVPTNIDVAAMRLRGVVEGSLIVVAFSLLPLIVLDLASNEALAWQWLSVALALTQIIYVGSIAKQARQLPLGGPGWRIFSGTWVLGGTLLLLVNGAGVLENKATYYLVGLLIYSLFAMILFARLFRQLLRRS